MSFKNHDWSAPAIPIEGAWRIAAASFALLLPLLLTLGALILVFSDSYGDDLPSPTGCRRLGLRSGTNLDDEMHKKYADGSKDGKDGTWRVKSLWIYPIKSCRGVELQEGEVVSTGLKYDRQFCFAQLLSPFPLSASDSSEKKAEHKWSFVTQRSFPLMSQVKTEVWVPDPTRPAYSKDLPDVRTGGCLIVTFPFVPDGWQGMLASAAGRLRGTLPQKSIKIPLEPTAEQIKRDYTYEQVTIWNERPDAINMGIHVTPELRYAMGVRNPLTLFRIDIPREIYRNAPRKERLGWQPITGFADAYPLHLLGLATMQKLSRDQSAGSQPLSVRRFRPNIVIAGAPPGSEDRWLRINIGDAEFHVVSRCTRCRLPNVDPKTGIKHPVEPDRTLKATRKIDEGAPKEGCLGMNVVPALQHSVIRVNDTIQLLEDTDKHFYIKG